MLRGPILIPVCVGLQQDRKGRVCQGGLELAPVLPFTVPVSPNGAPGQGCGDGSIIRGWATMGEDGVQSENSRPVMGPSMAAAPALCRHLETEGWRGRAAVFKQDTVKKHPPPPLDAQPLQPSFAIVRLHGNLLSCQLCIQMPRHGAGWGQTFAAFPAPPCSIPGRACWMSGDRADGMSGSHAVQQHQRKAGEGEQQVVGGWDYFSFGPG